MKRGYKDNFLDKQFERLSTMEKKNHCSHLKMTLLVQINLLL